MFVRDSPALDLTEAEVVDADLQRKLGHPQREACKACVRAVLDQHASVPRPSYLGPVHIHGAA